MKHLFLFLAAASLLAACSSADNNSNNKENERPEAKDTVKPAPNPYANATIEVKVFSNDTLKQDFKATGFGYDIYINGTMYIHQYNIPALPGNNGFKTKEAAQKAGELVAYKVKNNIMPPTVSVEELDSIGVMK